MSSLLSLNESSEKNPNGHEQPVKIFVGGLSYSTTSSSLKTYFSAYGSIVSCSIMMTPGYPKRSRGFGFVEFLDEESVRNLLAVSKHHEIDGRRVECKRAVDREGICLERRKKADHREKEGVAAMGIVSDDNHNRNHNHTNNDDEEDDLKKLFVGGLHYLVTDEILHSHFSNYGKLKFSRVVLNPKTKKSRGFGFLVFKNNNDANRVLLVENHALLERKVEVKLARPKI